RPARVSPFCTLGRHRSARYGGKRGNVSTWKRPQINREKTGLVGHSVPRPFVWDRMSHSPRRVHQRSPMKTITCADAIGYARATEGVSNKARSFPPQARKGEILWSTERNRRNL